MKKLLQNLLTFAIIFLVVNLIIGFFFPQTPPQNQNNIVLTPTKTSFEMGTTVTADLQNNTQSIVTLKNNCPKEPLTVLGQLNGAWVEKHNEAKISCTDVTDTILNPGDKKTVTFNNWNHAIFGETGNYKLQAIVWVSAPTTPASNTQSTTAGATQAVAAATQQQVAGFTQQTMTAADGSILQSRVVESSEFQIVPQGWLGWIWMTLFYQPLYNSLIFLLSVIPGHGLGFAIILLTLLIRTILLIPNQRALESRAYPASRG